MFKNRQHRKFEASWGVLMEFRCSFYCRKKSREDRRCLLWYGVAEVEVEILTGDRRGEYLSMEFCSKHRNDLKHGKRVLVILDDDIVRVKLSPNYVDPYSQFETF